MKAVVAILSTVLEQYRHEYVVLRPTLKEALDFAERGAARRVSIRDSDARVIGNLDELLIADPVTGPRRLTLFTT